MSLFSRRPTLRGIKYKPAKRVTIKYGVKPYTYIKPQKTELKIRRAKKLPYKRTFTHKPRVIQPVTGREFHPKPEYTVDFGFAVLLIGTLALVCGIVYVIIRIIQH